MLLVGSIKVQIGENPKKLLDIIIKAFKSSGWKRRPLALESLLFINHDSNHNSSPDTSAYNKTSH
jgi:hypothetical protein